MKESVDVTELVESSASLDTDGMLSVNTQESKGNIVEGRSKDG